MSLLTNKVLNFNLAIILILLVSTFFFSINFLPINAQNKPEKTQVWVTQIEYQQANNLNNVWPEIQKIWENNEEITVSLNSELEFKNLTLPLPLQVLKEDKLENVVQRFGQLRNSYLDSLIGIKEKENDFLKEPIYDLSAPMIENLQQQLTLSANLDKEELTSQKTLQFNPTNIVVQSITVSTTNLNRQTDLNLGQIASNNQQKIKETDLTKATKKDESDQVLQPKIKLKSENAKTAQKTDKLEQKQRAQKVVFSSSSSSSISQSSNNNSNSSSISSIDQNAQNRLQTSTASSAQTASVNTENTQILTVGDLLQIKILPQNKIANLPITENILQENTEQNEAKKQNKDSKMKKKVAKIEKFKYKNPFYISPEEEKKRNNEIETEKQKALAHNRKYKQYYSEQHYREMVQNNNVPDPNIYPYAIIDEQGKELPKAKLEEIKNSKKVAFLESVLNLGSIKAEARGLNNSFNPLVIYAWDNSNLTLDLPWGNTNNGTQFGVYNRHGGGNQLFYFDNNTNQIKISTNTNKCLDINGASFTNGTKVQIWDCHSGDAQKWYFNGTKLVAKANPNKCLDQNGSLSEGTRLTLWDCNGGGNQRWVAGSNDFDTQRSVRIYATPTGNISMREYGHVFVSFHNTYNGLINTMSAWGFESNEDYDSSNSGKYNNIADGDNIHIDNAYDWNIASLGRTPNNWRMKSVNITKKISDVYRYNSGYRYPNMLDTREYSVIAPFGNYVNCAKFSTRVWSDMMYDSNIYNNIPRDELLPSYVYNKI